MHYVKKASLPGRWCLEKILGKHQERVELIAKAEGAYLISVLYEQYTEPLQGEYGWKGEQVCEKAIPTVRCPHCGHFVCLHHPPACDDSNVFICWRCNQPVGIDPTWFETSKPQRKAV